MLKIFKYISIVCITSLLVTSLNASEGKKDPFVAIKSGVKSVDIKLNGETFTIMRNQTKGNKITHLYETTFRGKPQPIKLAPNIETVGELEFIDYMVKAQTDSNIKIIDSRKPGWYAKLRIPGAENVPFTDFDDLSDALDWMEEFGVKVGDNNKLDFTNAKTLVLYCNGYWCGQTPGMVKNSKHSLLKLGYPQEKIKYYRGGMQAWTSLGFTVVGEAAK